MLENLFLYILIFSYLLLPLVYLIFRVKKTDIVVMAASGILFFLLLFFHDNIPKNLRLLSNTFYTSLEYSVFTFILFSNIDSKNFKKIIIFLSLAFYLFQVIFCLKSTGSGLDSVPIGIESILVFIYIFYFLYEYVRNVKSQYIYINYCFWCAIGMMLYLGGNFFFNIMASQVGQNQEIQEYWFLTYIPDLVKNIFFAVAIIMFNKNPTPEKNKPISSVPYLDMI